MSWWKICGLSTKCYSYSCQGQRPTLFPHKKQYPLKSEVKEGWKPIIENLKEQGLLLISCNSPCNTPILGIKKSNGKWRLVQDMWIINEAAVPLHPVVPNSYTLLSEIPEWARYFSFIDLKDAFYSVPLAEESQFLFSFEDPTQPASQLTWTVLPQGFRDSPHLFGQNLSWDLHNFNISTVVVLQYADDVLLSAEKEEASSRASEDFLNFLAGCGCKASREEAQLCQQPVRCLGLIIPEGTRAIGPERIKLILNHPLPMTLRRLRGFWGITGYCSIWILGYAELAWPLYKLRAETQQAQTNKLVCLQMLKRLLRFFRLLSYKLSLWACPQGQNLICLSQNEKVWPWEFWPNAQGLTSNPLLIYAKN